MPRSYDVRIAALACDVDAKWLDNLLSHFTLPGVERARQGVERRIGVDGLVAIELVKSLAAEAGLPLRHAAELARACHGKQSPVTIELAANIELRIDLTAIAAHVNSRLPDAIEAAPRVKRGRPSAAHKRKTPDA